MPRAGVDCGLEDDHRGWCRTPGSVAREAARRRSRHYIDSVRHREARHPGRVYLERLARSRRNRGHA